MASLLLALLAFGCVAENEGIAPPSDRLVFPAGMAVHPSGSLLFVANANFDLRYNGGTIVVIDLEELESRLGGGGAVDDSLVILQDSTVRIGTFAADLAMTVDGSRLLVPVRGDNSVTVVDVDTEGSRVLACWEGNRAGGELPACAGRHVIGTGENSLGLRLPSEPYAVAIREPYAIVTHAGGGTVSLLADVTGNAELVDVDTSLPDSASGVAIHPETGRVYVSSRGVDALSTLDIFDGSSVDATFGDDRPALVVRETVPVDVVTDGNDTRSIAFHPDGREAYVSSRLPIALLTLDTSVGATGAPMNEWRDPIALGRGPSRVQVHREASGRVLVYAVCFDAALVYVVDPDLGVVDGVLRTPGHGPHAMAFDDTRRWILLADFATSVIQVFDNDSESETYREVIGTIGSPEQTAELGP